MKATLIVDVQRITSQLTKPWKAGRTPDLLKNPRNREEIVRVPIPRRRVSETSPEPPHDRQRQLRPAGLDGDRRLCVAVAGPAYDSERKCLHKRTSLIVDARGAVDRDRLVVRLMGRLSRTSEVRRGIG